MSNRRITESVVEEAALSWFEELGYAVLSGPDIALGELFSERGSYGNVILEGRLRTALTGINPGVPAEAIEDAYRKLTRTIHESPLLYANNYSFHRMLVDGVDVEYRTSDGLIAGDKVWLVDFNNADNNDWLIVNQFTVIEGQSNRRPDVIVFLNGLPVGVIELKNPGDEQATIKNAFQQIQTYKNEIPSLFPCNEILLVSDGIEARAGTLTADWEWFMPWRTIEGEDIAPKGTPELDVLIKGRFEINLYMAGTPAERLAIIKEALEHILSLEDGKVRFVQAVTELSRAFALAVPHEQALRIRDEAGFFQAVRAALVKNTSGNGGQRCLSRLSENIRTVP